MAQTLTAGDESPQKPHDFPAQPPDSVLVRADSPAALLALVPHLLGFVPEASLVVIGTERPHGGVKVTLRYDLPDPSGVGIAADLAAHAVGVLSAQEITTMVAVGYGPGALVDLVAAAVRDAARATGIDLQEFIRAEGGRYWSYFCGDDACCPAAGVPVDPRIQAPAATLGAAGEAGVLADRTAVAARVAPLTGIAAESMRQATRRAERHVSALLAKARKSGRLGAVRHLIASEGLATVIALVTTYRAGGRVSTDYQFAQMTVALQDLRVRDDAWARMDPVHRDAHRRLWIDVIRRAQPGYVAAPAALLAFVAWQSGDGALANVALDRALADDPRYSMALLLRQVITAGAPPSLARLPMTPEEVAASYHDAGEHADRDHDMDIDVHDPDLDDER
ncbi:MAG: DUF4192 domain-containing protein [Actinomycetota bacterium]|nr:DUF4192 domain-containing protein [Actinomycetota bacterium]